MIIHFFLFRGSFGSVKLVISQEDNNLYALKEIDKKLFHMQAPNKNLYDEVSVMEKLDHPNIIKIKDKYETETTLMIVLEYADGGTLYDLIREKPMCENDAKMYFRQLVDAVRYLHHKKMAHRDLKVFNLI